MAQLNRQAPTVTAEVEVATSARRKQSVELVLAEGLTVREAGERLGVSHMTIIRDLRATAAADDAEAKQMSCFWRDRAAQRHWRALLKAERHMEANDYAEPKSMAVAVGTFVACAKEIARLTGAYLPEQIEVATDANAGLLAGAAKGPATWALLQSMMAHGAVAGVGAPGGARGGSGGAAASVGNGGLVREGG